MLPKEYILEDGQIYYRKKPLYKQALFWTTVVGGALTMILGFVSLFLFIALMGTQTYEEIAGNDYSNFGSYDSSTDLSNYSEYELGQVVPIENKVNFTVQSIKVDKTLSLIDQTYAQALVVKLVVDNQSDEAFYFDEYYFSAIDRAGINHYYLDLKTYDVNLVEKLEPGSKEEVTLIFAVDQEEGYALTYNDFVWYSSVENRL